MTTSMVGTPGGVHRDRDTAAIVGDLDTAVTEDPHVHPGGVAGHGLVDGVVDDLPDQVVQTTLAGGADIHAWAFADSFQTLENGDRFGAVLVGSAFLLGSHVGRVSLGFRSAGGATTPRESPSSLPLPTVRTDSEAAFPHT